VSLDLQEDGESSGVTLEGFALTSWDLLLRLNEVFSNCIDRRVEQKADEIRKKSLFDQMIKNNHLSSISGLKQILNCEFGRQLSLMILKESNLISDRDVDFSGQKRLFPEDKILNKNSISQHIHDALDDHITIRSVQGQVEKTINALILIEFVEVDKSKSKGKMKALTATQCLVDFGNEWAVSVAKIQDQSPQEQTIG